MEKIPEGVSFERACFVEPLNTCLKGVVQLDPKPDDVVVILGQGPIGLLFTMLVKRLGATMVATDTMPFRREMSERLGRHWRPIRAIPICASRILEMTGGRGADMVIVAASAPGIVEQAVRYTGPARASFYLLKLRIRSASNFQARTSASGSGYLLVPIAPQWICNRNRLTSYLAVRLPIERTDLPPLSVE